MISEIQSCETSIIRNQNKIISDHICPFSAFRISELAFVPLKDPNQYIIIPEHELELNTLCNLQSQSLTISKPSLIYSDSNCVIQTPRSILKIRKSIEHRIDIKFKKNISYTIDQSEFELLNPQLPIVQESLHHENFNALRQSLDTMETSLQKIKNLRRNKTWIETGTDVLTYLGYASIGITTTYILYKLGFLALLAKLIPKKLCIRLFCVKTNVSTTPAVHYTAVATAPTLQNDDVSVVQKTVRLRT